MNFLYRIKTSFLHNLPYFFLLALLGLATYFLYKPLLPLFFEGDDLIVLWHIRVPVHLLLKPYYGWDIPIAGRYTYGQAWYEAAIYSVWGYNHYVYNCFGLGIRIVTIASIFFTVRKMSRTTSIALIASIIFTFISTGIESTYFVFHHIHFLFASLVLFGLMYFLEYFNKRSKKTLITAFVVLFIASYLYAIRVAGLFLLPLFSLIRSTAVDVGKRRVLLSFVIGIVFTLVFFISMQLTIPDLAYVSSHTRNNLRLIMISENNEFSNYFQRFVVSVGNMVYPPLLVDLFPYHSYRSVALPVLIFLILVFLFESLRVLAEKSSIGVRSALLEKSLLIKVGIVLFCVAWLAFFLYLKKVQNYEYYVNSNFFLVATLGVLTLSLFLYVGISYIKRYPFVASLLLISTLAAVGFYIPNSLFAPNIYSATESRYFSSSSVFLAIATSCLFYLLFITIRNFLLANQNTVSRAIGIVCYLFFSASLFFYVYYHFQYTNYLLTLQTKHRNAEKTLKNWKLVKQTINFKDTPVLVHIWTKTDIVNVMKMFFGKQSFGVIGDLPFNHPLPIPVVNYEEAAKFICDYQKDGKVFDYSHYYEFELDKNDQVVLRLEEGRERLKTWSTYCKDSTLKGAEVP